MNYYELDEMEKRWYRIRFLSKEISDSKVSQLKREFETLYKRSSNPEGMALLKSDEKNFDNSIIYYISMPKSFALDLSLTMSNYLITTSGEPGKNGLELIAGDRN